MMISTLRNKVILNSKINKNNKINKINKINHKRKVDYLEKIEENYIYNYDYNKAKNLNNFNQYKEYDINHLFIKIYTKIMEFFKGFLNHYKNANGDELKSPFQFSYY